MKEIQLNRGYVALVDDADYELVSQWNWFVKTQYGHSYAQTTPRIGGGTPNNQIIP